MYQSGRNVPVEYGRKFDKNELVFQQIIINFIQLINQLINSVISVVLFSLIVLVELDATGTLNKKDLMETGLCNEIEACVICKAFLPNPPKPIVRFNKRSKIVLIGQAPGQKVHDKELSFDDKSGDTLREWLGVSKEEFYDTNNFAVVPMGFCFPGKGKTGGDAQPRKECAPQWHPRIFDEFEDVKLVILIGTYAIDYYLKETKQRNLTETVRNFEMHYDTHFPIVHPSPLNFRWHAKNKWFLDAVVPVLQLKVREILGVN